MKTFFISFRILLALTLLTGVIYPAMVTGIGKVLFPVQSSGSLLMENGRIIGSKLIAQAFVQPKYFWPRPSSINYEAASSGATNLSVTASVLENEVQERMKRGFTQEMLYASGSGLDPHISPNSALSQIERVSRARNLTSQQTEQLKELLIQQTEGRQFGFLGEERINVLRLNLAIDEAFAK